MSGKRALPGSIGPSSKKLRFDEDDDEIINDADDLDVPGKNRKDINLGGYASDSSDESDSGPGPKRGGAKKDEDDDVDMFGGNDDDDGKKDGKNDNEQEPYFRDQGLQLSNNANKKGAKEYLELGDIEGQEFDDKDQDDSGEESFQEGDEFANDDDAPRARRKKDGMGYVMSGFNMKEEMETGRFNAEGTYIQNDKDPHAVHDRWLEDVSSKKAIKKAKEAKERSEQRQREHEREEEQKESRPECLKELITCGLMKPGETVAKSLGRLGQEKKRLETAEKKRQQKLKRKSKKSGSMDVDGANENDNGNDNDESKNALKEATQHVDKLCSLTATLFNTYNETDLYEETYESIIRTLIIEGEVPRGWQPPTIPE